MLFVFLLPLMLVNKDYHNEESSDDDKDDIMSNASGKVQPVHAVYIMWSSPERPTSHPVTPNRLTLSDCKPPEHCCLHCVYLWL